MRQSLKVIPCSALPTTHHETLETSSSVWIRNKLEHMVTATSLGFSFIRTEVRPSPPRNVHEMACLTNSHKSHRDKIYFLSTICTPGRLPFLFHPQFPLDHGATSGTKKPRRKSVVRDWLSCTNSTRERRFARNGGASETINSQELFKTGKSNIRVPPHFPFGSVHCYK